MGSELTEQMCVLVAKRARMLREIATHFQNMAALEEQISTVFQAWLLTLKAEDRSTNDRDPTAGR